MSQDNAEVVDADVSAAEFGALFRALCRWGRWGADDERGALHFLTPARVTAAAGLVREGVSVTLSLPVNTIAAVHNPKPADHHMTAVGSAAAWVAIVEANGAMRAATDHRTAEARDGDTLVGLVQSS